MELTWATVYADACQLFGGQTPGRALEEQLVAAFTDHPGDIQTAIAKIAGRYAKGKVHSPWPLVLTEIQQAASRHDVTSSDTGDRARQAKLAAAYIRNAGLYNPSEQSLLDDLFGDHGRLRTWASDTGLRTEMVTLWQTEQPRAQQADEAKLARAEAWKRARDKQHDTDPDAMFGGVDVSPTTEKKGAR